MSKKNINDKIIEALDLASEFKNDSEVVEGEVVEGPYSPVPTEHPDNDLESDYSQVRTNLKSLIAQGQAAVDGILNIASEGEQPRAYEVASQLLKNLVEANKELLDVHKQIKEIESKGGDSPKTLHTHNSLYLGSTKELQKLLGGRNLTSDNDNERET